MKLVINQTGLARPQSVSVVVGGWYYLGASSSPDLVKVTRFISNDSFEYVRSFDYRNLTGTIQRIERWIGEDLIARASATMRKTAARWQYGVAWEQSNAVKVLHILDTADLSEEEKQNIDHEQAVVEFERQFPEAEDRRRMREYFIEDSMREKGSLIVNVYKFGKHTQLRVTVNDLEELIARCGWLIVDSIINLNNEAQHEITRLEALPYLEQNGSGIEWWNARKIYETATSTPDL